ncbi:MULTISPECIES: WD40 repeat domain-containing protein [unclassified Tolypothrix]|uniref:WD40 repeat domain-containing protein n=1 Tax=unclassified Tolypothrix TaxID=2649714 RepID=UPI0005EAC0F0|nr:MULTISPECIES: PD40 domain-containing protein [unclassified Tolypothrix]BAY90425.1 WD-40 repeat-containing protein [Microchaete diplosiphon NIES-3275]EKF01036.1 WD domain, G-beta repeat protein [Tolypothrix sp. PCC 7601]MBE9087313.1 PD40 domain-containing protein [Tolypothrix sp. LEGE 11397]UYD24596.1 PD40 domain-containing protein [Tolypothrix sp. PCC 7712]UYD33174.1 PD40 domain-containing protein [Tolypothrix sp. PCC 7601]
MSSLKAKIQGDFEQHWRGMLSDYVTAIAWSPNGQILAASSALGEVTIWRIGETFDEISLQPGNGESVDCLAFSWDGQFIAASGQNGEVKIWRLQSQQPEIFRILQNYHVWIDRMAWSPTNNQLAFSLGRVVQVWNAEIGEVEATLNFDTSSVLDINWHPHGESLAVAGYQEVKIWMAENWDDEPSLLPVDSASLMISWSPDGKYIASGNMDLSISVLEWENPNPWMMRGFPGKIRYLTWSDTVTKFGAPLLAAASAEGVVVWEKQNDDWEAQVLPTHQDTVRSLQFQPKTHLLASASEDGCVCLSNRGKRLTQVLDGVANGFSCLSWHPQGHLLAAGGNNGELIIWSKGQRGQGFGKKK